MTALEKVRADGLEDAAMNYIAPIENEDGLKVINFSGQDIKDAFIAGAKWQAEQDDRDVIFWKGMRYAIEEMKKEAVEGEIVDSGFDDGTAILKAIVPDRGYDSGDKVKLIVIK